MNLSELNDDCIFEIFDRMPSNCLYAMADTCTRFLDLSGIQYRRENPSKFVCFEFADDKVNKTPNGIDIQYFGCKLLNVIIRGESRNVHMTEFALNYLVTNCSANWKMVRFEQMMLSKFHTDAMKHFFHHIETVVFHKCAMVDDFYEYFLKHCPRLKHLIISDSYGFIEKGRNKWLNIQYLHLESIHIASITILSFHSVEWQSFFRRNPKIKSFSCHYIHSLNATDRPVKLIECNANNLEQMYISLRGIGHLNGTYYDLSLLDQKPTFKYLELQFCGEAGAQQLIRHDKMLKSMSKFKGLHLTDMTIGSTSKLCAVMINLVNLQQINLTNCVIDANSCELLSKYLINIEKINCNAEILDIVVAFIRNSVKLKKIEINIRSESIGILIFMLNELRSKLTNPSVVTICFKNSFVPLIHLVSPLIVLKTLSESKEILLNVDNSFSSFQTID